MSEPMNNPATQALNDALASAFARSDFSKIADFYAAEAMLLPPRGKAVQGRDSITAFWLGFGNRFAGIVFTTADVRLIGEDVARETGTYATSGTGEQQAPGQGKYLFLWERVNGEWRIESSIWTRNPEARGGQGQGGGGQGGRGGMGLQGGGRGQQGPGGGGRGGGGGRPQGQPGGPRRGGANYEQSTGLYSDLQG